MEANNILGAKHDFYTKPADDSAKVSRVAGDSVNLFAKLMFRCCGRTSELR